MTDHKHTNNLIHASSPYLLQHAHNPVNWMEWGDEALNKAKQEDKLLLVSIGYSSCHWCHVMEHECFEQEDTAAIMNEHFVCVKIDREERPDIDQIYMDAIQLLTGRGGWPLNVFTLPDGKPLHGGTYFPKPEWERVLQSLAGFYRDKKAEAIEFANDLANGIKKLDTFEHVNEGENALEILKQAVNNWQQNFDLSLGGYNWAPKFPMPNNWEFFLQYHYFFKEPVYKEAVLQTLIKMAEGGINDALAGGFARYSTDSYWKVPHFEKMLYDNAQLMGLYAHAFAFSKNELFHKTVEQIHHFIQTEMTAASGAFYSALDADSEGVEGKFYVWKHSELVDLLMEDEPLFSLYYSVDVYGNWEHGNNILYKTRSDAALEKLTGQTISEIEQRIEKCKWILLAERNKRVHPGLDDKIIVSWNALMIKGYAQAYKIFANPEFLDAAERSADFILKEMWDQKKLLRIHKNGKSTISAFAEDYACLCEALLLLYEASGEEKYLLHSHVLLQRSIELFYNKDKKLFYFTAQDEPEFITRKTDVNDDVIPSANSIFGKCLLLLSYYFDQPEYVNILDGMIEKIQGKIQKFPSGFSNWMQLILQRDMGFYQIIISGPEAKTWVQKLHAMYIPNAIIIRVHESSQIPLLADKKTGAKTMVYICKDKVCQLPVESIDDALRLIG